MWAPDNQYVITGDPATKELNLFHLVVAPSFACNLRCRHCYLPDHSQLLMPLRRVRTLVADWAAVVARERGRWGGVFHLKGEAGQRKCRPRLAKLKPGEAEDIVVWAPE